MVKNGNTFWRKIVHKNEWKKMVKITNYAKMKRESAGKCLRLQLGDIKTAATLRLRLGILIVMMLTGSAEKVGQIHFKASLGIFAEADGV